VSDEMCDTVTFDNSDRFVGYLAHLKLWDDNLTDSQLKDQVLKGLTVYKDVPESLLEEPFQMRGGVESFPFDCPNCYGSVTPRDDEACGSEPWGYETWDGPGAETSQEWPSTCQSGQQMPVNVETVDGQDNDPQYNVTIEIGQQFSEHSNYTLINDGKTVKVMLGLNKSDVWDEFEFHWPSEFEVDGKRYPLEMRVKRCESANCTYDVFLYDVGTQNNKWIDAILPTLLLAREPVNYDHDLPPFNLSLLHNEYEDRETVYSIEGGNTIPPCQITNYMIYKDIGEIDFSQFKEFMRIRRCKLGAGKRSVPFMFGNYRQRQSLTRSTQRHRLNYKRDINECASNPCQNGASCVAGVNSYSCTCLSGYVGDNCETNIDECASNPCQNGANCTDGVNSYSCSCLTGFGDKNCETELGIWVSFERNVCYQKEIFQGNDGYIYKICPFGYVEQYSMEQGATYRLGYYNTVQDDQMEFTGGTWCGNKQREAIAVTRCGNQKRLVNVEEGSTCVYTFTLETPDVCQS